MTKKLINAKIQQKSLNIIPVKTPQVSEFATIRLIREENRNFKIKRVIVTKMNLRLLLFFYLFK